MDGPGIAARRHADARFPCELCNRKHVRGADLSRGSGASEHTETRSGPNGLEMSQEQPVPFVSNGFQVPREHTVPDDHEGDVLAAASVQESAEVALSVP